MVGTPERRAEGSTYVYGSASVGAQESIVLRADTGLVLVCGDSRIEVSPDKIVLSATTIETKAGSAFTASAKSDGPVVTIGDEVEILSKKFRVFTDGAALEVDKEVRAKGAAIRLGYSPDKPAADKQDATQETKPLELVLSDWFLDPYAGKKYHLMVDGLRFEGETDGEGTLKHDVPKSASQAVVRLWVDEYPEGRQQIYRIDLDKVSPPSSMAGAQQRLKNLGYYGGPVDGVMSDELRAAIAEFQRDHEETHGLEPTGELDGPTQGALKDVHRS